MSRVLTAKLSEKGLRGWFLAFFAALAVPTTLLIHHAYSQLKWEAFRQHQVLAEELAARMDERLRQLIAGEEARPFTDYSFLVLAGDPAARFIQRSPLSDYPAASTVPGLVGYFQVDAEGVFSTPLLPREGVDPTAYGISGDEMAGRRALADRIRQVLAENRLVQGQAVAKADGRGAAAPAKPAQRGGLASLASGQSAPTSTSEAPADDVAETAVGQAAFDQLSQVPGGAAAEQKGKGIAALGRVEDLQLEQRFAAVPPPAAAEQGQDAAPKVADTERGARRERNALPEPQVATKRTVARPRLKVHIFESEVDPFEFSLLDSGHMVLFRRVWRDGQRYVQGLLIDRQAFLQGVLEAAFRQTALAQMSDLILAYRGNVIAAFRGEGRAKSYADAAALKGTLLYQARLPAPFSELELLFSVNRLPDGPGGTVVNWLALILVVVMCGGLGLMYRLAVGQIRLARQQQDFVSAVSHELKTPLTSIRMYSEMLHEGWAPEAKKADYYSFIHEESERLSRLINNVLQLARMTRNDFVVELKPVAAGRLLEQVRSKVSSQVRQAKFQLNLACESGAADTVLQVDPDCFTQIIINLVDNALKFCAKAPKRVIDVSCRQQPDGGVVFAVRDYGRGVPKDQMPKIFRLFYRSENELTRETVGTGIGLALVSQLAQAMGAKADVVNVHPGAEFRVVFPGYGPH